MSGRVVVLNGTASSGKSTLARAFQASAASPWVIMAQDDFAQCLVPRWVDLVDDGASVGDGFSFVRQTDGAMRVEVGPIGARLLHGYRRAVGAVARAGNDVVVDEATFDAAALEDWARALQDLRTTWVKVECDIDVCEQRERDRPDRPLLRGLARGLQTRVHSGVTYDVVVSTTAAAPDECARLILDALPSP